VLTACFPQDRAGFLVGLASWGAACALARTVFRNAFDFGVALAGTTAGISANDQLVANGVQMGQALIMLAVTRCSEICGIVSAGIILARTELGGAQRRLAILFAALAAEITERFADTRALAGPDFPDNLPVRGDLVRASSPSTRSSRRRSANRLSSAPIRRCRRQACAAYSPHSPAGARWLCPDDQARQEAGAVLQTLPGELRSVPVQGAGMRRTSGPPYRAMRRPLHIVARQPR
jgi:hypothetical protein